jgi:PPOX class probable FMN-dependent enzyme
MARIETEQQLRDLYGEPKGRAVLKQIARLETHSKRYLSLSPFCLLATHGSNGGTDVSPRGEGPGFVHVLDDTTIALPDRPGNNRIDSFRNIVANPNVGLIFLIPGVNETLRINGHAEIRTDADLLARFEVQGKLPKSVLVISIDEVFLHCAKALIRSGLWDVSRQIDRSDLPTMSTMIRDMSGDTEGAVAEENHEEMMARYKGQLY